MKINISLNHNKLVMKLKLTFSKNDIQMNFILNKLIILIKS